MAEEVTPTPAATSEVVEPASDGAVATPADGGAVTPAPASTLAPATVDHEALARKFQADADRLRAENAQLKAAAAPAPASTAPASVDVGGEIARVLSLRDERDALRTAHPDLDASLFNSYLSYDSPEAFRAKVESEARTLAAMKEAAKAQADAEVRAIYEAKYGPIAPVNEGDAPDGEMTLAKYQALSFAEKLELQKSDPAAVDRILKSTV